MIENYFHTKFRSIIRNKNRRKKIFQYLKEKSRDSNELYLKFYELYCEYQIHPSKEHLFQVLKQNNLLYNHENFHSISHIVEEEENFIIEPLNYPKVS